MIESNRSNRVWCFFYHLRNQWRITTDSSFGETQQGNCYTKQHLFNFYTAMATVKFNDFSLEKVLCLYGMLLGSIRWGCEFPKESCSRGGRSGNCIIIQTVPKSNPIFVSLFIQNVSDFKHAYPYQWTCFIPPREIKNIKKLFTEVEVASGVSTEAAKRRGVFTTTSHRHWNE